jgi:ADP-ribose pyrophosphatase YjhB (NUDIX family)
MFTIEDERNFLSAAKKLQHPHKDLPLPVFESLCNIMPVIGCEIIIRDDKNRLLLTWRDDKWYHGWHFPGGLLRAGDTFKYRINQTAIRELGVKIKKITFLKPLNSGRRDSRGYGVSLIFLCQPETKPKIGKFFSKMPNDIISVQRILWKEVVKNL